MGKTTINVPELEKLLIKSISNNPTNVTASFRLASRKLGINYHTVVAHYYNILRKKEPIFMIRTAVGITINTKRVELLKENAKSFKLKHPLLKLKGLTDKQKIELFDMLIA
jgi:hypothetical protein